MKQLLVVLTLLLSMSVFSNENMSVESAQVNFYPWQTSAVSCYAATRCPNGRVISCRTFGYSYGSMPYHLTNSCSWRVIPGRAIRCQGYVQSRDYYGRMMWAYADIPVRCF